MELLSAGKISGTHHLKGAVKVTSRFEELKNLENQKIILEFENDENRLLTITNVKHMAGLKWIVEFEEITNKNEASQLQNGTIKVRRDLLGLSDDEVLIQDIIGIKVFLENGESIGEITDIYDSSAHDIFVVEDDEYEAMIPDVDEFVKLIDYENKKMVVTLIEGLRERKK